MKFFYRFLPLQISLLLHGLAVLFLSWDAFSFKPESKFFVDVWMSEEKTDSSSAALSLPLPQFKNTVVDGTKNKVSEQQSTQGTQQTEDTSWWEAAEGAVTEEPVIISEPKNKQRTEEARKHGYTGQARLKIFIDAEGNVQDVKLLNVLKYGLDQRAIDLAKQIRLSPAKINGKPVGVVRDFTINFKATD